MKRDRWEVEGQRSEESGGLRNLWERAFLRHNLSFLI